MEEPDGQVTMHSQNQSLFFGLPQELRDMIYELVFRGKYFYVEERPITKRSQPNGILLACKQSHYETVKLWYKTVTFHFEQFDYAVGWIAHTIPRKYSYLITKAMIWVPRRYERRKGTDCDDITEYYTAELVKIVGQHGITLQNVKVIAHAVS